MDLACTKKLQQVVKDLILFDSSWRRKEQVKTKLKLSKKTIDRIKIYKELVKNSLQGVISNIYPNTKKILKTEWSKLLSNYLEVYPPISPILNRVAANFPNHLSRQKSIVKKFPFISELALYEWLELETYEKENQQSNGKARKGLSLNPIHVVCEFHYPVPLIINQIKVSRISKFFEKKTNVLIYRDPKNLKVRFFELSDGTFTCLKLLKRGLKGSILIKHLAGLYKVEKSEYKLFRKNFCKLIKNMQRSRILI